MLIEVPGLKMSMKINVFWCEIKRDLLKWVAPLSTPLRTDFKEDPWENC